MSKNKFFKKLLIAGLCVVSATAVIGGVAACKKNDDDETQKEQTLEYTVSYDLDGGEWGTATHADKVTAGGKLTKPGNPTKTGKVFDKWILVSTQADYDFESAVNANLALKAVWKDPVASYTVTLDLDGGTWTGAQATYTATAGQKLSDVLGTLLDSEPTKTGHEFLGLLIGTEDADSDTVISKNVTVKVNWKLLHQHTWAETPTEIDANWHGIHATCNEPGEGCATAIKEGSKEAHVDANHDGKCDECGYDDSASLNAKFTELVGKQGLVYANTFTESKKLGKFSAWGAAGVYGLPAAEGIDDTHYVEAVDGVAKQVAPGKTAGGKNLGTVVDFGGAKELGVLEGHFNFSTNKNGSKWCIIQFYNNQEPTDDNLVFSLFTPSSDGVLKYITSKTDTAGQNLTNALTLKVDTSYSVYYKFDLSAGKVTMTLTEGNTATTILDNVDIGVSALTGMRAVSGDSGNRLVNLDNVAVVYTAPTPAEVKAANDAKVAALAQQIPTVAQLTEWGMTSDTALMAWSTASDTAKSAYDTAVAVDGVTVAQLQAAYAAYDTAIKNATLTYGDTFFDETEGEFRAELYTAAATSDATHTAYEAIVAAKEAARADVANLTANDAFELFQMIGLALAGDEGEGIEPTIKNSVWFAASPVTTIKVSDGTNEYSIPTSIVKKEGDFLHISDINAIVAATASDKTVTKYYEDSSKTQEATFWKVQENLIVYVDVASASSDRGVYTYTVTDTTLNKVAAEGSLGNAETIFTLSGATCEKGIVKFGGSDKKVTLTLNVQAGQTVTLALDLKSGSTVKDGPDGKSGNVIGYKKVDLKATPSSGLSLTSASDTVTVDAVGKTGNDDTTHEAVTTAPTNSGTIVFTATTTGTVTIELARVAGATTQMSQLVITVADPA